MLEERNTCTGFLTDEQYDKLAIECAQVGLWLRTPLELGATYGWRWSELLNLRVDQVDLPAKSIRLNPGETKNNQGREVSMTSTLVPLLTACVEGNARHDRVITRPDGPSTRLSWYLRQSPHSSRIPKLLFHDLRRTAARSLRRAGVAEGVIMNIGGWKAQSIFERYAIVAPSDIKDADGQA